MAVVNFPIFDIMNTLHTRISNLESLHVHDLGLTVYDNEGIQRLFLIHIHYVDDDSKLDVKDDKIWSRQVNFESVRQIVQKQLAQMSLYKLVKIVGHKRIGNQNQKTPLYYEGKNPNSLPVPVEDWRMFDFFVAGLRLKKRSYHFDNTGVFML